MRLGSGYSLGQGSAVTLLSPVNGWLCPLLLVFPSQPHFHHQVSEKLWL